VIYRALIGAREGRAKMDGDGKKNRYEGNPARDNQAALIELLEHLLSEYWGMRRQERPRLLPGELPDALSVEVPIPAGCRVVGSAAWSNMTNIVLNCTMSRDDVVRYYEAQLVPRGWTKLETADPFERGGFAFSRAGFDMGAHFCLGEDAPALSIRSVGMDENPLSVQVTVSTDPETSPCSKRQRRQFEQMRFGMRARTVLPELKAPTGAMQMGGGGGSGNDHATSEAWLKTELAMSAVLPHYETQLAKAGWSRRDGGQSGPVGWSAWDFTYEDEKWHGLFTVIADPWTAGEYRLKLYAEAEGYTKRAGPFGQSFMFS